MNSFKDFNIEPSTKCFKGDKIKVERLLNREIAVYEYEIKDSIKVPGTDCLHLQIKIGETWHVVFTSSKGLMEAITRVPEKGFPFTTTIIRDQDFYRFT